MRPRDPELVTRCERDWAVATARLRHRALRLKEDERAQYILAMIYLGEVLPREVHIS